MSRTPHWLLLLAILITAAGLRFWRIDSIPPGFYIDEAYEGLEAWHIFTDPSYRPVFLTGNIGVAPLNSYAAALMFGLFRFFGGEAGPVAMRVTAGCFGLLGVLALYGLASELQKLERPKSTLSATTLSAAFPLFAAASLAVMRWHFHFSRIGIEPILVPVLWAGATWLLLRGWRTGEWLSFAGSGVLLATSMYAYQGAWIIPFLMIPAVGLLFWESWQHPAPRFVQWSRQGGGLVITVFMAGLLFAPLGWFFWQHPDLVLLRPAQVAVGGDKASAAEDSLGHNVWATAKMFGPFGSPGDGSSRRNLPGAPALNFWLAMPFYLGLGLALWRMRRPGYAIVLIGLAALLLLGVVSNNVPHFHRILGATAPTALLCGVGLDWVWQRRPRSVSSDQLSVSRSRWSVVGSQLVGWSSLLFLGLGGATAAQEYFVRWANLPALYDSFEVGFWQMGQQIAQLPPEMPVYLTPRGFDRPTLAFALQTKQHPAPAVFDGRYVFPLTDQVSSQPEMYVVIEREDKRTDQFLAEFLPTATVQQELWDRQGKIYARFYLRPPNAIPQRPPQHALAATLGDGIALVGYDIQPARVQPGAMLYVQLHWLVQRDPQGDWKAFTRLVHKAASGEMTIVAGQDSQRGRSSLHSDRWQAGWRVLDEHGIQLPADLAPGEYHLQIGLYKTNGERLPQDSAGLAAGTIKIE